MLLQIIGKVRPFAIFQDGEKAFGIYLYGSIMFNNIWMVEFLVHLFFPYSMLFEVLFHTVAPMR